MNRLIPLALIAPVLLGGAAYAMDMSTGDALSERDQRRMDAMIGDRIADGTVSCISVRPTTQSSIISNQAILYRNGNTVYSNDFDGLCPVLRSDSAVVSRTITNRLCSGDILQIVEPTSGASFGSCTLGEFTSYRRPD